MRAVFSKLVDMIKRARITKGGADDADYNVQQVSYLGKVADAEIVFPYGMSANLPLDSLVLLFNVNGNEQNRAGIGSFPPERKRNLEPGEVAFFHPFTNSFIYFRNSGDIDIDTQIASQFEEVLGEYNNQAFSSAFNIQNSVTEIDGANININARNVNMTCSESLTVNAMDSINLTATNAVDVTCDTATVTAMTSIDFDTPIATFTTDVNIMGNLTVGGTTTLTTNVTSAGINIGSTHIHLAGTPPGTTGPPQ